PVAIWDSTNKRVIANTYGSAKLTVSFASPANGEPFSYSFAITVVRPVAEYEDSIQNFSWLIGDLPVETIFKIGSKEIVNAEQDGRALTITDNKLTDVATTSHTQMSRETVTVYNDKVGYVLQLETYAMAIDSADEFQAYLDSGETRVITGYFELKKDIHIQTPWQYRAEKMTFSGVLEGNGYTLTVPMRSYGLFGSLKGTLQNLHIHVTDVTTKGSYKSTSIIAQDSNTKALVKNMYVTIELAKNANFPYAVSLFGSSDNTFQLKNFVADLGDQLPADGYGYNMYGVLFQYISYISTQGIKEENFANVYIISSGLKILVSRHDKALGDANNSNIYAGNDTDLYDAYTPAEGENKYKIAAINRYNTYADFVGADHTYTEFDTKYWEVIDGGLYWKGVYADGVEVVATDKAGEAISEYQLQATTDAINLSMVDMYGNSLGSIDYTIVNNDGNLKNENGVFSLTNAVLEDKTYTITLKAVVDGITIERNITIQAVAIRTTYTQEVYLATNSDYNGTDEYVLTNAGLTTLPTGITSASLNGVALTVADGQLPDVTMHYVKKFEEYGKTRETYMEILVGTTSIVSKKADQAPLTLVVKTATETIEFTNLFVCTDVIQVASDLERFEVRDLANAETQNNDGYYVMTNNIDASALNFAHQRDIYNPSHRFVGAFDGRGYTISNLDVGGVYTGGSNPVKPCGLFGNLYGADILNVGFVNVSAEGGSVLGSHNSNIGTGFCTTAGSLQYSESIYPAKMSNGYAYASTRIENVYIQVADSVTSLKGALSPTMNDYNFLQNVVVEWNPTNAAALSAGYGSLVGVGTTWNDANKPKRENIVVLSSVQLNNDMATCSGVAAYANRATMESQNTASLEGFVTYWTTTSNSPVWKTANWQQNN
ncbi:MAG: hypothetical protein IKA88_07190, partial [Clostridia bacterium]|nr:hypothetical protein [Clostridia bacterium]